MRPQLMQIRGWLDRTAEDMGALTKRTINVRRVLKPASLFCSCGRCRKEHRGRNRCRRSFLSHSRRLSDRVRPRSLKRIAAWPCFEELQSDTLMPVSILTWTMEIAARSMPTATTLTICRRLRPKLSECGKRYCEGRRPFINRVQNSR